MITIRPGFFFDVKFSLGQILATPDALAALEQSGETPAKFLKRHISGDWGDMSESDKKLNDEALTDGSRLMSAYQTSKGMKIWIITEATDENGERCCTTVMLPENY
jgi:hypothetical protein